MYSPERVERKRLQEGELAQERAEIARPDVGHPDIEAAMPCTRVEIPPVCAPVGHLFGYRRGIAKMPGHPSHVLPSARAGSLLRADVALNEAPERQGGVFGALVSLQPLQPCPEGALGYLPVRDGQSCLRAEGLRFDLAPVLFDGIVTPAFMTIETSNTWNFGETATSGLLAGVRGAAGVIRCFHAQVNTSIDKRYSQAQFEGFVILCKSLKFS